VVIVLIFFLYNSLTTENQTAESWFKTIAMDNAAIVHRPISPYISRVNFCAFKDSYSKITRFCSGIFSSGIPDFFSEASKVHFSIYSFNILGSMLGLLLQTKMNLYTYLICHLVSKAHDHVFLGTGAFLTIAALVQAF
jgi:hypothetical protein